MKKTLEIDVFDFDKTIYSGDCSLDFYIFCLRSKPSLIRYLPYQIWHFFLFVAHLEKRTKFKSNFFRFLKGLGDTANYVEKFWDVHAKNVQHWYEILDHSQAVIISASPSFLIEPMLGRLQARWLIATIMDPKTGKITGENCRGREKVVRLNKEIPAVKILKAYSDSLSDMPLLSLAKEKYLVKKGKVSTLDV